MDGHTFDRLVRVLGTSGSRRSALGALVAATPLATLLEASAKKRSQHHKNTSKHQNTKHHKAKEKHKGKGKGKDAPQAQAQAEACWRAGTCTPSTGSNVSRCDLGGSTAFHNLNCTGCNISRANLRGADLRGANLTRANLSGSCLIDANLSGAVVASTTNLANAVYCRTVMPNGSINNSGCAQGNECCPSCDATHPCPNGQVCCGGRCVPGNCCGAGDCQDHTCQTKDCVSNTCTYTNQGDGGPGNGCPDPRDCCGGTCCPVGQKCCGGQCVDANTCCTNNVPGTCPQGSGGCCGGECLTSFECCTNNQPVCPAGQTCVAGTGSGPTCCAEENACGAQCCNPIFTTCCDGQCLPAGTCCQATQTGCDAGETCVKNSSGNSACCANERACGDHCCPLLTKCCGGQCVPFTTCCTNGQVGVCDAGKRCCNSGNCNACCNPGNPCDNNTQCGREDGQCTPPEGPGAGPGAICSGNFSRRCCFVFNTSCDFDEQCCSNNCTGGTCR